MVKILPLALFLYLKSQQPRFRINKENQRNKTDVTVSVDSTLKKRKIERLDLNPTNIT